MRSTDWYARAIAACVTCIGVPAMAAEDEGNFTAHWGGKVHLDFARFGNDESGTPNIDDAEVRRAGLHVSGKLHALSYKLEIDMADPDDIRTCDAHLAYAFGGGRLTVGQFELPFTLDDVTGSGQGIFLERSHAVATLAPGHKLGVSWQASADDITWSTSLYSLESVDARQQEGTGLGGRFTWSPSVAANRYHLGLSLVREHNDHPGTLGAPALRVRPRPAGHLSDGSRITLMDFASGRDTDVDKWALELGYARGSWLWQGEYIGARFDDGAQHGDIRAWYGAASWLATGESHAYAGKSGYFGRITPARHPGGALEFVLRYDTMRGRQHPIGQAPLRDAGTDAWTLGANWYVRPGVRLMLNLIHSRNHDHLAGMTVDRTRALTGRVQFDF